MARKKRMAQDEVVTFDRRFRGPPTSANGGYACGVIARSIDTVAEVTLRRPPPLDVGLHLARRPDGRVSLEDDEGVIAEAVPRELDLEVPEMPSILEVEQVAPILAHNEHPFPGCFVCGPARHTRDGLRIFPGIVADRQLVAGTWRPDVTLLDPRTRTIQPEFVWAALDCPGGWSLLAFGGLGTILLGRLTARVVQAVVVGERYVVIGWPIGGDGKREHCGSALFSESGALIAFARATWFRK